MLDRTSFVKGASYADYQPGKDKDSGLGITGLILGGGALAAAAKFGVLGGLWKWVLLGIGVGALFHGYVPEEWVVDHLGGTDNWLAVPGAVLLGIPL
ncbi:MAG: DUF2167 domain-containing protein, partial [Candidatus Competibacteraceae bacterium]|nr:DUF2167 domain-containing protein [Candidatus Competibacteraceae bacterium]